MQMSHVDPYRKGTEEPSDKNQNYHFAADKTCCSNGQLRNQSSICLHSIGIKGLVIKPHRSITGTKKQILPCTTAWMDLESIMLSEISQSEKDKCHMISLMCGI